MGSDKNPQMLTITEIYKSVQGESSFAGWPCTFIRLTGCPLRCRWCDTVYGFDGGSQQTLAAVMADVERLGCRLVEVTGGEPLAQPAAIPLMQALVDQGYQVLLETGGSESVADLPRAVHCIMDLKAPGSGMVERNRWENLNYLKPSDEIKIVIASREDFDWARQVVDRENLDERFRLLLSPAFGLVQPADLVDWMLAAGLTARLNLQIHKYIWSPKAKGV